MKDNSGATNGLNNLLSWRRPNPARPTPQLVPMRHNSINNVRNTSRHGAPWKDKDNWRVNAHPVGESDQTSKSYDSATDDNPVLALRLSSSSQSTLATAKVNERPHPNHQQQRPHPRLQQQQQQHQEQKPNHQIPLTSHQVQAQVQALAANPQSNFSSSFSVIKPSSMGNGIIGRSADQLVTFPRMENIALSTSPPTQADSQTHSTSHQPSAHPTVSYFNPLQKQQPHLAPATQLLPLQIHSVEVHSPSPKQVSENETNENWMLTPTSSLPSIPGTPYLRRDPSIDINMLETDLSSLRGAAGLSLSRPTVISWQRDLDGKQRNPISNEYPSIRTPIDQFHASLQIAPRTPSPGFTSSFTSGGPSASGSLLGRTLGGPLHSSPKRSPLSLATQSPSKAAFHGPQAYLHATHGPLTLSPGVSPKLINRTVSPAAVRLPAISTDKQSAEERAPASIASMLAQASAVSRPGTISRRDSFASVSSSVQGGHTLTRSRASSQVLPPNSPISVASRIGIYRPPHLRNRDSVSGLRSSVAHYDRICTPSLRGLSRSRESSLCLSRPASRPPSTVPFYRSDTIPEDAVTDTSSTAPRSRLFSLSSHTGWVQEQTGLAKVDQLRREFRLKHPVTFSSQPEPPVTDGLIDGASLVAKLEAESSLYREYDQKSESDDDRSQEFFDLSADDMLDYGASDGYPLSRHSSIMGGRPVGDVFDIGDLLGPGIEHDGHFLRIAQSSQGFKEQNVDLTGSKLEVVRKLGEGSYAIVYLVREVEENLDSDADGYPDARAMEFPIGSRHVSQSSTSSTIKSSDQDADQTMKLESEDLLSTTLKANGTSVVASYGFNPSPSLEERRRKDIAIPSQAFVPKEYALKCLCKRDLSEDMLELQRLEATIHQSIPAHPNIVTLYRTYETPDWLFLILEYCPGQDLYYWLEQAHDSSLPADLALVSPVIPSHGMYGGDGPQPLASVAEGDSSFSFDATPPSPSLLASTAGNTLLSRRRVRLIVRMFRQICDAVQFCHNRGISHRDIKPENFIVEDRRDAEEGNSPVTGDTSFSTTVESVRDGDYQVIVKMTDFGLATADERCDDFDCGSKPYMAYECHNNVSATYDPKQADIWSLGVVLLNLLFHRSPFTEPSLNCPSFVAYCQDPIKFLMESFDGLTETVASFLTENVFCSVSDDPADPQQRISAGDFSRWACGLVEHMGLSGSIARRISRGASMHSTMPLVHSRTASMSTLPSLLSSPRGKTRSLVRDPNTERDHDINPDATFRVASYLSRQGSMSSHTGLFTPDILPSPSFTPSPHPHHRNPFDGQYAAALPQELESFLAEAAQTRFFTSPDDDRQASIAEDNEPQQDTYHPAQSLVRAEMDSILHYDSAVEQTLASVSPQVASQKSSLADTFVGDEKKSESILEDIHNESLESLQDGDDSKGDLSFDNATDANRSQQIEPDFEQHAVQSAVEQEKEGHLEDEEGKDQALGQDGSDDIEHESTEESKPEGPNDSENTMEKTASITHSNHSKRRKRGARKGRVLAKQLKRSQSVENLAQASKDDPGALAREREATIRELALASETLARQMSRLVCKSTARTDSDNRSGSPTVVLSPPTAAAAAKYTLDSMTNTSCSTRPGDLTTLTNPGGVSIEGAQPKAKGTSIKDGDVHDSVSPNALTASRSLSDKQISADGLASSASSWTSAATRRERINERKATAVTITTTATTTNMPILQDSGRSKLTSWRDRNQSTATFSSFASTTTLSSVSSTSSGSSSVYSTSSAPAALQRKYLSRGRSRLHGLLSNSSGLDTIAERDRSSGKKELDINYLAGIFGAESKSSERKKKDSGAKASSRPAELSDNAKGKRIDLRHENDQAAIKALTVDHRSPRPDGSKNEERVGSCLPATGVSQVSRSRRPSSSSCSSKTNSVGSIPSATVKACSPSSSSTSFAVSATEVVRRVQLGLHRDASTSTSSLIDGEEIVLIPRPMANKEEEPTRTEIAVGTDTSLYKTAKLLGNRRFPTSAIESASLSVSEVGLVPIPPPLPPAAATASLPAPAPKKRGVGKFLLGVRDSIKNL